MFFKLGQPILISQPHFLNAEEKFINAIKGMSKPDRSIHDSFLKIYPVGFVFKTNNLKKFFFFTTK
jgi:hypothetical protein